MAEPITVNSRVYAGQVLRVLALHAEYACANTGVCCEEGWGIRLSQPESERIVAALRGEGRGEAEIGAALIREERGEQGAARFAEGACGCVFHGVEGGGSFCTLHRVHGHGLLPTICQSFPRIAVRTPAGIYLTLTCACPTAAKLLLMENGLREVAPGRVHGAVGLLGGSVFGDHATPPRFSAQCQPRWDAFDYFWRWGPEWMANAALPPGLALYGLGLVVGHLESLGAAAGDAAVLIEQLDGIQRDFAPQLVPLVAQMAPQTMLGAIYFETLLNVVTQVEPLPPLLAELRALPREALVAAYDELARPRLAEFELIERNYIGSRLYANPLTYFAGSLRAGYFVVVLMAVGLRFAALAHARAQGRPIEADDLMAGAGVIDKLLLHNATTSGKVIQLLEAHIHTDIRNLAQAAIF